MLARRTVVRKPKRGEVYRIVTELGKCAFLLVIESGRRGYYLFGAYFCAKPGSFWPDVRATRPILMKNTYSNGVEDGSWHFVQDDPAHPLVVVGVPHLVRHPLPPIGKNEKFILVTMLSEDGAFSGDEEWNLREATQEEIATLPRTGCAREGWIEGRLDRDCPELED